MITGHKLGIYRFDSEHDGIDGRLYVTYVRWVDAGAAGQQCILREGADSSGTIVFDSIADGDNFLDVMKVGRWLNGIYLDTMDAGVLYVYTK